MPSVPDADPGRDRALADRDQFVRDLFEASPDCLKMLDLDGRLLQMNAEGMCLMEIDDFAPFHQADWLSFWPAPGADHARQAIESARNGQPSAFLGPCPTAKGTPRWWDVRVLPVFDSGGQVSRLLSVSRDVTERIEAERRLVELNETLEARVAERTERLEASNRDLRQRNRDLEALARVAAHTLQEPLRRVVSYTELLETDLADTASDDARGMMGRLRAAALRMRRLIQDLGVYSRLAQQERADEVVSLAELVRSAAAALAPEVTARGATVDLDAATLPDVQGDAGMLRRMLEQLLHNALAFARPDVPPVVRVRAAATDEGAVALTVEDNGVGIDPRHADRIFQPFERLLPDGNDDRTGIGLTLVRLIAERHGGHVEITPSDTGGARFTVTLPAAPASRAGLWA